MILNVTFDHNYKFQLIGLILTALKNLRKSGVVTIVRLQTAVNFLFHSSLNLTIERFAYSTG